MKSCTSKNTIVVACRTIAAELNLAIRETGCPYPVLWVDAGLHRSTSALHSRLQAELDRIENVGRVILAFGFCGHALEDLTAGDFELIFPRVDDCITLLLDPTTQGKEMGTFYLTPGWLDNEISLWNEYQQTIKRYGQTKADHIYRIMLTGYRRLGLIDTSVYSVTEFMLKTRKIAAAFSLTQQAVPGTIRYLKKLLTGPWDDEFIVIAPGESVGLEQLLPFSAARNL
ncbi:MAG TPA: hypothetical protein DDW50_07820 [Firmicutes bacterium]|jgi:hypothetical protein|nr:hypothetical protein [Bacillota bacterium]